MSTADLPRPAEVLPHRPPFLFLDRCLEHTETRAVAERTFDAGEPFFAGHFPDYPVVPGVILVEALAQTLAYLALRANPGQIVLLTGVDECRIRRQVRPGETVRFEVEVERTRLKVVTARGVATVAGEKALTAKLMGYFGAPPNPSAG